MYNVQRDADGNVHEHIKQPGKNDKYVINGMPPRTAFHPSHHCRSGGIWGHVWAIVTSVLWCRPLQFELHPNDAVITSLAFPDSSVQWF